MLEIKIKTTDKIVEKSIHSILVKIFYSSNFDKILTAFNLPFYCARGVFINKRVCWREFGDRRGHQEDIWTRKQHFSFHVSQLIYRSFIIELLILKIPRYGVKSSGL